MKWSPLGLALALLSLTGGAGAAASPLPLSDAALAEGRGGIMTPLGYDVGLGATVRTYLDGSVVLETRLNWTDAGPVLNGSLASGDALARSAVVPSALGETRIVHQLSEGRIASVVMNTADGRTLRQQTDIVLVLPQLENLQARALASRTAEGLQQAVGAALADAAR